MTTVINNPPAQNSGTEGGNGTGLLIGIAVCIILAIILLVIVVPYLRQNTTNDQTNSAAQPAENEAGTGSTTQYNIPDKIDVNINP